MTTWADEYVTLLEDCEKRSEKLTDWELGFVDSLQRQLAEGRRPTQSSAAAPLSAPSNHAAGGPSAAATCWAAVGEAR